MQLPFDSQFAVIVVMLGVLAILLLLLLRRAQAADPAFSNELSRLSERLSAAEAERDGLRADLQEARIACARLEAERDGQESLAAGIEEELEATRLRLTDCERDISTLKISASGLAAERDAARAECEKQEAAHAALEEKLRAETTTLRAREDEIATLKGEIRGLTETLRAEREKHAALLDETERNRAQFVNHFKAISGEILQTQSRSATEAQKVELEKIITPFRIEIEGLKTNLKDISEKAEKERQSLGNQLLVMQTKAAELAEEANGLARALRGEAKRQGDWGEMILERILEAAGLREGTHFTRQQQARGAEGARLIPDIMLHLPGERDVVIDSKVTLVAYQDMVQADDPEAEAAALKRHVQAVRNHIRSLSDKDYGAIGRGAFGSVMMFLPVEGALSAALSAEPRLVVEAAERRVHLMTPTTLMPVLQIVEHLWTIDTRNRSVDAIMDRAGKLHDKFVSVVEAVQKIGDHLRKASDCQADALNQMRDGRGNVIGQVDKLRRLGAKARKTLPADLLDGDEDDHAEDSPEAAPVPALTAG